jgi:short subunit dehydrogenase-like uncharacterized protein
MRGELLIYGATGYTGGLIARAAALRGLAPVLAGRDVRRLEALAHALDLEHRVAGLADPHALDAMLASCDVLINAAGPFSRTARPLLDACLRTGTHYLDITGEVDVMAELRERDGDARAAGILLMPGAGFDVLPSDCLAAHVAAKAEGASWLAIGIRGLVSFTRGSLRTLVEQVGRPVRIRRDGRLLPVTPGAFGRGFDYDGGLPCDSQAVSWGDLVSAWHTTGIPDIEVYFETTPAVEAMLAASRGFGRVLGTPVAQALLKAQAELFPEGPSESERGGRQATIVAEAGDAGGVRARSRLHTPDAYTMTGHSAAAVADAVLAGHAPSGYQTPGRVFGPDFALAIPGVAREDVDLRA